MNGYTATQTSMHGHTQLEAVWWPWREFPDLCRPGEYTVAIHGGGLDSTAERWPENHRCVVDDFGTLRKVTA